MVRKASEGLCTYDILGSGVDELEHLACKEPSFTGLISDGYDILCIVYQIVDIGRRIEMLTLSQRFGREGADKIHTFYTELGIPCGLLTHTKLFSLVDLIIEAVVHEIDEVGYNSFCTFALQEID